LLQARNRPKFLSIHILI